MATAVTVEAKASPADAGGAAGRPSTLLVVSIISAGLIALGLGVGLGVGLAKTTTVRAGVGLHG